MPKPINEAGTPEALRKEFSIQGGIPGMSLDEVIVPVAIVAQLGKQDEETAERAAFGVGSQPAVVANRSAVALFNPAGSGTLITVQRAILGGFTGGSVSLYLWDNPLLFPGPWGPGNGSAFRDRRVNGTDITAFPVGDIGVVTMAVPVGIQVGSFDHPGANSRGPDIVNLGTLIPGTGLHFLQGPLNVGLNVSWSWTERRLTSSAT